MGTSWREPPNNRLQRAALRVAAEQGVSPPHQTRANSDVSGHRNPQSGLWEATYGF